MHSGHLILATIFRARPGREGDVFAARGRPDCLHNIIRLQVICHVGSTRLITVPFGALQVIVSGHKCRSQGLISPLPARERHTEMRT